MYEDEREVCCWREGVYGRQGEYRQSCHPESERDHRQQTRHALNYRYISKVALMVHRFINSLAAACLLLVSSGVTTAAIAGNAMQASNAVGSVTLVLGQASIVSAQGVTMPLQRGAAVRPGDRIETARGGHVHIRFVDDALVSVRPSSRLIIEEYQYNPAKVTESQVRFKLETGVARAISGAAAEGAKERFRLNTPLVAIGVRGTDFVVNSQSEQTTAHVNQGAIVMAPLGAGCQAHALGPCNTATAMLVSAQMGNVLAEYRDGLSQPEIKPHLLHPTYFAVAPDADGRSPRTGGAASRVDVAARQDGTVMQVSSIVGGDLIAAAVDDHSRIPRPAAMMWGHWSQPSGAGDFSVPFRVAAIEREVTVGDRTHVLYRVPSESGLVSIQPTLGEVGFQLKQVSTQFRPWGEANQDAMAGAGTLSINFASRQYQTRLELNHATAGSHTLHSQGIVLPDGIFGGTSLGQKVVGATTLDGKNAGYMYEKTVESGVFNGITLWGR